VSTTASIGVRRGAATHRAASFIAQQGSNWVFLIPTLFFFVGWQVYPIFRVLWMSFTDYHFLRTNQPVSWVGLQNYVNALSDPLLITGLQRAATFTVLFLPGMIFLPMLLAIMVDRITYGPLATTYRLILLIPAVIPGPLVFVLWKWLYNFTIGPIDYVLIQSGLVTQQTAPQWLGDPRLGLPAIAIMEGWGGLGYHTMFYLAGLAAIPRELTEAARVDGANEWALFWNVTLPRLRPIVLVLVVLRFGTAMAVIDEYLILGGFNRALPTYTWTVYMWDLAFQRGSWPQGYASAVGWIGAFVVLAVVAVMFWVLRDRDSK